MLSLGFLNGTVLPDIQMKGRQASAVDGCQKFLEVSILLTVFKEGDRRKINYKNTLSILSPFFSFSFPFLLFPFLLTRVEDGCGSSRWFQKSEVLENSQGLMYKFLRHQHAGDD